MVSELRKNWVALVLGLCSALIGSLSMSFAAGGWVKGTEDDIRETRASVERVEGRVRSIEDGFRDWRAELAALRDRIHGLELKQERRVLR